MSSGLEIVAAGVSVKLLKVRLIPPIQSEVKKSTNQRSANWGMCNANGREGEKAEVHLYLATLECCVYEFS